MQTKIDLALTRETKGTVVYESDPTDPNPMIRSLYLMKTAMAGARPKIITVTVEGEG